MLTWPRFHSQAPRQTRAHILIRPPAHYVNSLRADLPANPSVKHVSPLCYPHVPPGAVLQRLQWLSWSAKKLTQVSSARRRSRKLPPVGVAESTVGGDLRRSERTHLLVRQIDGLTEDDPLHHLAAGWCGQRACVAVVAPQRWREEVPQDEGLQRGLLLCGGAEARTCHSGPICPVANKEHSHRTHANQKHIIIQPPAYAFAKVT